jgi:hypothetical protein
MFYQFKNFIFEGGSVKGIASVKDRALHYLSCFSLNQTIFEDICDV